jgi:hypothetical protein
MNMNIQFQNENEKPFKNWSENGGLKKRKSI